MKASALSKRGVFIMVIFGFACASSSHTVIKLENKSNVFIDSAVVYIQNYKCLFTNIRPKTTLSKAIFKDSIVTNNHDITIRTSLYDKNETGFTGGFYYNDLSGFPRDMYFITIQEDLNVIVK